jgi:hypothetical protein
MSAGLAIGLAIGIALAVGVAIGMRTSGGDQVAAGFPLEELKLRASAAHGNETFAIATGPMDGNVDGVFLLDFLKGDLTCFVLNPRVGKFTVAFKTNVTKDLPPGQGKTPAYALATGRINVVGSSSNVRPAASVVYVADCNSGAFAAYTMPWSNQLSNTPAVVAAPMKLQDIGKARDLQLRE